MVFHNKFILLIKAYQVEFKWRLVTFFFFPLNAGDIFHVISRFYILFTIYIYMSVGMYTHKLVFIHAV